MNSALTTVLQKIQLLVRPPERCDGKLRPFPYSMASTSHFEQIADLIGEDSLTGYARAPTRVVQAPCSPANLPYPAKDLLFLVGEVLIQPVFEQRGNSPWKSNDGVAGKLRTRLGACRHDGWDLMIG